MATLTQTNSHIVNQYHETAEQIAVLTKKLRTIEEKLIDNSWNSNQSLEYVNATDKKLLVIFPDHENSNNRKPRT